MSGASEAERLYDAARRADNRLHDFYRSRAEELTRRLRDIMVEQATPSPTYGDHPTARFTSPCSSVLATIASSTHVPAGPTRQVASATSAAGRSQGHALTINERALLNRFRVMDHEDRAALLRIAQRFTETAASSR